MTELVSILMPAKNVAGFIGKSIASILEQSYQNFELIIIDDHSSDNTRQVIESYTDPRINVIPGPGTGISDAFNAGLSHAKGKYLCRCDADDLFTKERLTRQVEWLTQHSDYIAVCGQYAAIDEKDRFLVQYNIDANSENIDNLLKQGRTRTHFGTFLVLTESVQKIGGCRPFFVTAEDIDLQLRLSEIGSIFFLAENAYLYRLHKRSITHSQSSTRRIFFENFARQCHKQRQSKGQDVVASCKEIEIPTDEQVATSVKDKISEQMISQSWYWYDKKNYKKSVKMALRTLTIFPLTWKVWKCFFLINFKTLLKKSPT